VIADISSGRVVVPISPGRAFSVQSKLLVAFVVLTIAAIAVLTTVGYFTARQSLTDSAERAAFPRHASVNGA
jgi:hypothetical protein